MYPSIQSDPIQSIQSIHPIHSIQSIHSIHSIQLSIDAYEYQYVPMLHIVHVCT